MANDGNLKYRSDILSIYQYSAPYIDVFNDFIWTAEKYNETTIAEQCRKVIAEIEALGRMADERYEELKSGE